MPLSRRAPPCPARITQLVGLAGFFLVLRDGPGKFSQFPFLPGYDKESAIMSRKDAVHLSGIILASPRGCRRGGAGATLLVSLLAATVMVFAGCAEFSLKSPSPQVKSFFVAGHEADMLSALCLSSGSVDLSPYAHLAGVKYPPTLQVDILNQPPSRPHKPFAVLECPSAADFTSEAVIAGLKTKAREIGADALIICQPGVTQGLPGLPASAKMQAVAIKYKFLGKAEGEKNS